MRDRAGRVAVGKAVRWLWARVRFSYGRSADWAGKRTLFVLVLGAAIATVVPVLLPRIQLAGWLNWLLGMIVNYERRGSGSDPPAPRSEVDALKGRVAVLTDLVSRFYTGRALGAPGAPPAVPEEKDA